MTNLEKLAQAFGIIGWLCRLTGDRLSKAYAMSRARIIVPDPKDNSRWAPMAPRAERRKIAKQMGVPFRPVYGYCPGK